MARFDRKVERTKKSFEFTQKEKIVETNKDVFKKNFTFKWVQLNIKTVCVFLVDFLLVTLLIIPFMMQYLNATLAFVLGHGIITSLVIVFTGFLINKEKIKAVPFISRFLFMFILLGASSALSMAELVCLTALGVVSLFTGIVSLGNSDAFMGMFTFMILLVSYALIILTFRKRRMLFKAKEVIYTGYEIYLYILSYVVLMTSCLLIYLHVVQVVSMTSPLIMVTWLVPLVAYLTYESVLIFEKDELNINGKKVLYRSIKNVQIIENKNKYHLIIRAKGNEYLYKTNQKNSQHVLECLKKYCPRIDKNRD